MMEERNMSFDLERIKQIPISSVAERFDSVRRAGVNHVTTCPWHDDHHPSLTLYERGNENRCYCFSCNKCGSVIDYVMQHQQLSFYDACLWLANEYGIIGNAGKNIRRVPKPQPKTPPPKPSYTYIPNEMLSPLVSTENSLCKCLMLMFSPKDVEWLTEEYMLGAYAFNGFDDFTIFPSIDQKNRICNLKIQHYDTDRFSPRFAHSDNGSCRWLGSMWSREGILPQKAIFNPNCMFGEHLLPRYPNHKVVLVESPKNALFGSLYYPQFLWLATGNKNMLKREVLEPLCGRDVIVIPDRDAIDDWTKTISTLNDIANFTVSDFSERYAPVGELKFDIADYIQQLHPPMPF